MHRIKLLIFLLISLNIVGCGFKLRTNTQSIPDNLQPIYLDKCEQYFGLMLKLRNTLCQHNVRFCNNLNSSCYYLQIVEQTLGEETRAYASDGQNSRLQLTYRVKYRLMAPDQKCIITGQVFSSGSININENDILGDSNEKQELIEYLEQDSVYKIIDNINHQNKKSHENRRSPMAPAANCN